MFEEIVGSSPALQAVLSNVQGCAHRLDGSDHRRNRHGKRTDRPRHSQALAAVPARFVSVNCAAIPRDLIASELFGHEKGHLLAQLSGAWAALSRLMGGRFFWTKLANCPAETQIALLRVLQEREFQRVAANQSIRTDVRVVAATNRKLEAAIAEGGFREDLFYRLNVFPIEVPRLRERREDIPLLVEYFVDRYASKAGKRITGICQERVWNFCNRTHGLGTSENCKT